MPRSRHAGIANRFFPICGIVLAASCLIAITGCSGPDLPRSSDPTNSTGGPGPTDTTATTDSADTTDTADTTDAKAVPDATQPTGDPDSLPTSTYAFVDVNVVPMDTERVLTHHTVIVRGGSIAAVAPVADIPIPGDALVVDGAGEAYLTPGLADMHMHERGVEHLPLYVANGVTTALQMGRAPPDFAANVNHAIDVGIVVGPTLFFAYMLYGPTDPPARYSRTVATPAQGRQAVADAAAAGYEFIKVYNGIDASVFAAIVAEARSAGLAVVGHGVRSVGLPDGMFQGQVMVAHGEEFIYAAFAYRLERNRIAEVTQRTLESGGYVTPNLSTFEVVVEQWGRASAVDTFLADPRAAGLSPEIRSSWDTRFYATRQGDITPMLGFLRELTLAFSQAGVPLLTGTDSPGIPGMYPGYSIHDDLDALVRAGLSRYEALAAATRVPGEFVHTYVPRALQFGRIEPGMKADLVLVRANPLDDLEVLRSPLGVMSAGRWRDADALAALVAAVEAANRGP